MCVFLLLLRLVFVQLAEGNRRSVATSNSAVALSVRFKRIWHNSPGFVALRYLNGCQNKFTQHFNLEFNHQNIFHSDIMSSFVK